MIIPRFFQSTSHLRIFSVKRSPRKPHLPDLTVVEQSQQSAMATTSLYPLPTKEELQKRFVGKSLNDVEGPAAVLDISKLKNNCLRMLEAVDSLDFGWRAHIKTHKVWKSFPYIN
jgi:hypothetical protein